MVDNCIQVHRCTTDITGWLKGGHPTFKDGIVDRKACFHGWENCCYRIVQIRVRECQGFYVYELNPSPEGRYRYCARGWTVSGPSVWLEELWIVQKGFHVEDVVRAKTTHVIINNDIAIRKWFKKCWKPSNKQIRKQKLKTKWSGGINFMNKPWVWVCVFLFCFVLFQTLKFCVYTQVHPTTIFGKYLFGRQFEI